MTTDERIRQCDDCGTQLCDDEGRYCDPCLYDAHVRQLRRLHAEHLARMPYPTFAFSRSRAERRDQGVSDE